MSHSSRRLRAVVFDLDGTLTQPNLDFDAIAAEIGLGRREPILEAMAHMSPMERAQAEAILLRHERLAAETAELNAGAAELVAYLADRGLPMGLLTRNCRECAERTLLRHGLLKHFAWIVAREDAAVKPAPDGLHLLAERFRICPTEMLMVGDFVFDVRAGRAAGCRTVLLTGGRIRSFAEEADFVVCHLHECIPLVERLLFTDEC